MRHYKNIFKAKNARLNRPNKLIDLNGIKPGNDMSGGWVGKDSDKDPYVDVTFKEMVNGRETPFLAEIKGVITQGLDGLKNKKAAKLWPRKYQVSRSLLMINIS